MDHRPVTPSVERDLLHKHNLPLLLTAILCLTALVFICLFTACLKLATKHRRSRRRWQNPTRVKQTPGCIPALTRTDQRARPLWPGSPPERDRKNPEGTTTPPDSDLGDYVDIEDRKSGPYQRLDLSEQDEHIYHSLHGGGGSLGVTFRGA